MFLLCFCMFWLCGGRRFLGSGWPLGALKPSPILFKMFLKPTWAPLTPTKPTISPTSKHTKTWRKHIGDTSQGSEGSQSRPPKTTQGHPRPPHGLPRPPQTTTKGLKASHTLQPSRNETMTSSPVRWNGSRGQLRPENDQKTNKIINVIADFLSVK